MLSYQVDHDLLVDHSDAMLSCRFGMLCEGSVAVQIQPSFEMFLTGFAYSSVWIQPSFEMFCAGFAYYCCSTDPTQF